MKVGDAKRLAARWVDDTLRALPGFEGAFLHGSIHDLHGDDVLPATSDVDVGIVIRAGAVLPKLGKVRREGVLLEGAVIGGDRIASAEQVLADYRLAPSFRRDGVLADPTGQLARLQRDVARAFDEPAWVHRRILDARDNVRRYAGGVAQAIAHASGADPPPLLAVVCWLFAEGNLAHMVLAAAGRNPTVRRRYAASRDVLEAVGRLDLHERMLSMLGCDELPAERIAQHLDEMASALERAGRVDAGDLPFASDLAPDAHPIAVQGSRALLDAGLAREAVFWIAVTGVRCLQAFEQAGARDDAEAFGPAFAALLGDFGVPDVGAVRARTDAVVAFLPELLAFCDALADAAPGGKPDV